MIEQVRKHKWYILCYILYVSIVFTVALENASKKDFWPVVIVYCITFPLVVYLIWSFILYIKRKR